ncbi:uncharacterized protein ARB_06792 [Trichophyton benhamiae CBS 112371]|uniref:Uncharacterized protein n=1 Tax=Arthroderma benhamiae (strain ATCC MYA-4681 / CBS 112371) TaxID=663331 RepID=D4ARP9_ARTBC|nr:uncharacterized protein ARB_06792 [Trichophyton benhamiae CBS 112371]EFE34392.1 hypothetical protein ARB_06792 [Trichophyton benhamiae CBS 112371]
MVETESKIRKISLSSLSLSLSYFLTLCSSPLLPSALYSSYHLYHHRLSLDINFIFFISSSRLLLLLLLLKANLAQVLASRSDGFKVKKGQTESKQRVNTQTRQQ